MEIMTEAMPVGLCSVTAPSGSAARGAPVKGDGRDPRVIGSRLAHQVCSTLAGLDGDLRDQVPTNEGCTAPHTSGELELTELN